MGYFIYFLSVILCIWLIRLNNKYDTVVESSDDAAETRALLLLICTIPLINTIGVVVLFVIYLRLRKDKFKLEWLKKLFGEK